MAQVGIIILGLFELLLHSSIAAKDISAQAMFPSLLAESDQPKVLPEPSSPDKGADPKPADSLPHQDVLPEGELHEMVVLDEPSDGQQPKVLVKRNGMYPTLQRLLESALETEIFWQRYREMEEELTRGSNKSDSYNY